MYSQCVEHVKCVYYYVYNENVYFSYLVDNVTYFFKLCIAFVRGYKIEPMQSNWIATSLIHNVYSINSYEFNENYYFFDDLVKYENPNDFENDLFQFMKTFQEICEGANSLITLDPKIIQCMIVMKHNNKYIYYSGTSVTPFPKPPFTQCKYSFLSIEYTHPKMKTSIFIELDKYAYCENNQLLSSIFVLRYLKHQALPYIFDMDYTLNVMDDSINMFELQSTQYILLTARTYQIITTSKSANRLSHVTQIM